MKTSSLLILAIVLSVIAGVLVLISKYGESMRTALAVSSFEQCAAAGFPIMESYPEQCRTPDGRTFVNSAQQVTLPGPDYSGDVLPDTDGTTTGGCIVGGCSAQLCTEASEGPAMSDCMYRPEYACYKGAVCERLASGQCGWRETPELAVCLSDASFENTDLQVY